MLFALLFPQNVLVLFFHAYDSFVKSIKLFAFDVRRMLENGLYYCNLKTFFIKTSALQIYMNLA